jgi:hypothetical protein
MDKILERDDKKTSHAVLKVVRRDTMAKVSDKKEKHLKIEFQGEKYDFYSAWIDQTVVDPWYK